MCNFEKWLQSRDVRQSTHISDETNGVIKEDRDRVSSPWLHPTVIYTNIFLVCFI